MKTFRAATWNVNSIRQRLAHLGRFVDLYHPDLVCLQETKVRDEDFPVDEIRAMGFETVLFHGQKSYNGVAILVKSPVCHHQQLIWCGQDDRRHLAVVLDNGLHVHNFYVPSGGGVPDATVNDKFAHKLQFLDEMGQWVAESVQKEQKMLLLGDLNVAPFDNDVWNHKRLQKQIGHTPGECDRLIALHKRGDLIDVGRHFILPDQPLFSWWGYRYKLSVQKDYGWRLDHILASQILRDNLRAFHVVRDTRLWDKPSDHVPLIVDLQIENLLPLQVAKIKSNQQPVGMYKMQQFISQEAVDRRLFWIEEITKLSGHFDLDSNRIEAKISDEIADNTLSVLLDHLRLCSAIPESYGHDTSEEKLYSKYTDSLISATYSFMGLKSMVLVERADAADVEVVADNYSFVADAKVFRLSRTAKNQKDFKIQAMDMWKRGKPFAMVVCPLYQLPSKNSQIYQQAATRNVCIFSYSHLAVLAQLVETEGTDAVIDLLHDVFKTVQAMNPSKDANGYWQAVNRTILGYGGRVQEFWRNEKIATVESITISKDIALSYYATKRESIMRMTHEEALKKLIDMHKIDSRIKTIKMVSDNLLMCAPLV